MTVRRDIGFAHGLALDLHLPAGPAAALCVYLHGGGWRLGSRRDPPMRAAPDFFDRLTGAGLAVASVDYRLTGEATWPAQLDDVQTALAFLVENHAELGVPVERTVLWGVSAGGQLAAMAALSAPDHASTVDAVVCWYPPTDLEALSKDIEDAGGSGDRSGSSREGGLVGGALDDHLDVVRDASPVNHLRARGDLPPFLFLHGDRDLAVPPRQSHRLAVGLSARGGRAVVELVAGASHMFPELEGQAAVAVIDRSVRFLLDPGLG